MTIGIPFDESFAEAVGEDPKLAAELLEGAVNAMFEGDLETGRVLLRHHVNGTIGFQKLAEKTGKIDKNLMRMLGPKGSPTASNLFAIIAACADAQGLKFKTQAISKDAA